MAADKLDMEKVKELLTKQLKDVMDPKQVKFRVLNREIKKEFGTGMFIPALSAAVKFVRPDLAKPARKSGNRRGRKAGPKSGRRGPGRPPGRPANTTVSSNGAFLVQIGRTLKLVRSRDRVQAAVDQHVGSGQSLSRLKVYTLRPVTITTQVVLE
jgi:hypothetical protein